MQKGCRGIRWLLPLPLRRTQTVQAATSQVEFAAAAGLLVLGLPLEVAVPGVEGALLQARQPHHEPWAQFLRRPFRALAQQPPPPLLPCR